MTFPLETFADVLHRLIDEVLHGSDNEAAHSVVDGASGTRTPAPDQAATSTAPAAPTDQPAADQPPADPTAAPPA